MVDAVSVSLSALRANGIKAGVAANNIASAQATGAVNPGPGDRTAYTPQDVVMVSNASGGVNATVAPRDPATVLAYDPNALEANDDGLIAVPNVDLASEIVDLQFAEAAYKASLAVLKTVRDMDEDLLSTFDERV
jgi:flagellar basal-body rod protein FlgC